MTVSVFGDIIDAATRKSLRVDILDGAESDSDEHGTKTETKLDRLIL